MDTGDDGHVIIWEIQSGKALQVIKVANHGDVLCMVWVAGREDSCDYPLIFGSTDGSIHIYQKQSTGVSVVATVALIGY